MAELVIDRATWIRGSSDSVMRDYDGHMCCLGFDAIASGVRVDDIVDRYFPTHVGHIDEYSDYVKHRSGDEISEAICINDDPSLTDAEREQQLTPLLLSLGWDAVRFVGEGRP